MKNGIQGRDEFALRRRRLDAGTRADRRGRRARRGRARSSGCRPVAPSACARTRHSPSAWCWCQAVFTVICCVAMAALPERSVALHCTRVRRSSGNDTGASLTIRRLHVHEVDGRRVADRCRDQRHVSRCFDDLARRRQQNRRLCVAHYDSLDRRRRVIPSIGRRVRTLVACGPRELGQSERQQFWRRRGSTPAFGRNCPTLLPRRSRATAGGHDAGECRRSPSLRWSGARERY